VRPKLAFMLVTSVAFGAVPQVAPASCSGSACNSFAVEGKNYSASEKRVKAVFINKAKSRGIRLKGCVIEAGKCGRTFVLEIDPGLRSQMSESAATRAAVLDVKTADFLPQQGNVPRATAQQCRRQCIANDTLSKRANCLKNCLQATAPSSRADSFKILSASLEPDGTISTAGPTTIMPTRSRPFRSVAAPSCELNLSMMCGSSALPCGRCVPARSAPERSTRGQRDDSSKPISARFVSASAATMGGSSPAIMSRLSMVRAGRPDDPFGEG
jgi:hypothetical protein